MIAIYTLRGPGGAEGTVEFTEGFPLDSSEAKLKQCLDEAHRDGATLRFEQSGRVYSGMAVSQLHWVGN